MCNKSPIPLIIPDEVLLKSLKQPQLFKFKNKYLHLKHLIMNLLAITLSSDLHALIIFFVWKGKGIRGLFLKLILQWILISLICISRCSAQYPHINTPTNFSSRWEFWEKIIKSQWIYIHSKDSAFIEIKNSGKGCYRVITLAIWNLFINIKILILSPFFKHKVKKVCNTSLLLSELSFERINELLKKLTTCKIF